MDLFMDVASEAVPWFAFFGLVALYGKVYDYVEGRRAFRKYEQRRLMESRRRLRHLYYR